MKQFIKYALPGFLVLSIIVACEKEYETIDVIDDRNVEAYIKQNNLNVQEYQDSGVYYQVVNPGTGADLEYSEEVPIIFTSRSLDGKFVSTDTFSINNRDYRYLGYIFPEAVRIGIKEVLKKRSGTLRMIIPSRLAYGRNGLKDIPGNASLDMTVKVLDKNKIAGYDDFSIKNYLTTNNLTGFIKTSSGVYYKIAEAGTGSQITVDSTIVVEYTGKYLNGKIFDKTVAGSPVSLQLNSFIQAWREVIPLIKQGGSMQMIVPSALAYGIRGDSNRGMPVFACLDFTVKVTDVTK